MGSLPFILGVHRLIGDTAAAVASILVVLDQYSTSPNSARMLIVVIQSNYETSEKDITSSVLFISSQ
eukprot:209255-Ditylum_brightwellii.AAC.1